MVCTLMAIGKSEIGELLKIGASSMAQLGFRRSLVLKIVLKIVGWGPAR